MTSENTSQETAQTSADTEMTTDSVDTGRDTTQAADTISTSSEMPESKPGASAVADAMKAAAMKAQGATKEDQSAGKLTEGAAAAASTTTYKPDYKFKSWDKEYELDPFFKSLVKDEESEKKIKSLHAKAYGFDSLKDKFNNVREEYQGFKKENEVLNRSVSQLGKFISNKDYENFFQALKISDEDIFEYAQKRLNMMSMPADQRAEYERQAQIRHQNYMLEAQNQQYQQQYQEAAVQTRAVQLDTVLSRPDIGKYASAWDRDMGQEGAFRSLVIQEGQSHFFQTGHDLSAEEAAHLVLKKFGKVIRTEDGQMTATPGSGFAGSQQGAQQTTSSPPIIPHVSGKGTSPVKKAPKSLDDLKKLAQAL
jgi:hypothetical protein